MDKNVCSLCGTENETEYKFCKNCGNPLVTAEKTEPAPAADTAQAPNTPPVTRAYSGYSQQTTEIPRPVAPESQPGFFGEHDFDGISTDEMAAFVGKKAVNILPKFTKMHFSNSKISWCWPAAILGWIFGPLGSALWFFYRKMYKIAVIFAVIGAVVTVSASLMTIGSTDVYNETSEDIVMSFFSFNLSDLMDAVERTEAALTPAQKILENLSEALSSLTTIASGIFSGLYGFYFYKSHCTNKITAYRTSGADQRFYKMGLASIGGVSGGMLALGIVLMYVVDQFVIYIEEFILAVI